jgi:hypothetical protein
MLLELILELKNYPSRLSSQWSYKLVGLKGLTKLTKAWDLFGSVAQ